MKGIKRGRPSPSMIVAGVALVAALAGTAIAGPLATKSALSKAEKKQSKKIAKSEIAKAGLKTSSAFNENSTVIASLGAGVVTVASATVTTHGTGRILATGSAELVGANADERGQCLIQIDGTSSAIYESTADDIATDNEFVIAVNFAVTRPAGTYTANLQCGSLSGTVGKDDAGINVYGLGA